MHWDVVSCETYEPLDRKLAIPLSEMSSTRQVSLLHKMSIGNHKRSLEATPLAVKPSPNMKGLQLSMKYEKGEMSLSEAIGEEVPLIVGTIRMGFGHHRYAALFCLFD